MTWRTIAILRLLDVFQKAARTPALHRLAVVLCLSRQPASLISQLLCGHGAGGLRKTASFASVPESRIEKWGLDCRIGKSWSKELLLAPSGKVLAGGLQGAAAPSKP